MRFGQYGAAGLMIRKGNQFFLTKRSQHVQHPGTWALPGGALEPGETALHGAIREFREELGVEPRITVKRQVPRQYEGGWTYTTVLAEGTVPSGLKLGWETTDSGWFTPEEMNDLDLHPDLSAALPQLLASPKHKSRPRVAWKTWSLGQGATLRNPWFPHSGGEVFKASCPRGCKRSPSKNCACGIYVAPSRNELMPWASAVFGKVRLHGRVFRGESPAPDPISELRAERVSLYRTQWVSPVYAHLVDDLTTRYGLPFKVREDWPIDTSDQMTKLSYIALLRSGLSDEDATRIIRQDGKANYPARVVDEVHPGLFLGGSWKYHDAIYDLVITVCSKFEASHNPPASRSSWLPMFDIPWVDEEAVTVAAEVVVRAVRAGRRTLVRCHAGLNRSALVVGVALAELTGKSGVEIIQHLRSVRSPRVLYNQRFESYLARL